MHHHHGRQRASMSQDDLPRTGDMVIDTMTMVFRWLGRQVERLLPPPALPAAADMTDRQLLHAVHRAGAELLNGLAPIIGQSFARYGAPAEMGDPRFPHGMPVKVRGQVLT